MIDPTLKLVHFMIYNGPMSGTIRLNMHEAKTHLSRHLAELEEGERESILLCRRNVPIAEIRLLPQTRKEPRPIGLAASSFQVPQSFFDPLPDDLLEAFEGKTSKTSGETTSQ